MRLVVELYRALDHGEDRVIGAHADARARVPLRAALAHENVAGNDAARRRSASRRAAWSASRGRCGSSRLLSFVPSISSLKGSGGRLGADDAGDADLDEVLAVAALAARILATALLEGDDLRAAR